MKKIILVLSLFLFSFISIGQQKDKLQKKSSAEITEEKLRTIQFDKTKIYGLSIFRINTPADSIIELLLSNPLIKFDSSFVIRTMRDRDKLITKTILANMVASGKGDTSFLVQIDHPISTFDISQQHYLAHWDKNTKVYILTDYKVGDTKVSEVQMIFYKNRLVKVIFSGTGKDLAYAIASKYGDPDEKKFEITQFSFPTVHWTNKDVITTVSKINIEVEVIGINPFLSASDKKAIEVQSTIDKAKKKEDLKDL